MINKKLTLMKMNKLNEYYLEKHGTDGYDDFREFMLEKEIPVNTLEFIVKRLWSKGQPFGGNYFKWKRAKG